MNYMRKVIYLKKREHEKVMPGQGFARLEKREGNFWLHVSMNGIVLQGENPVYIVYEQDDHFYASLVGTTGPMDHWDLRCLMEDLPGEIPMDRIYGLLVGNSDHYLSGLCPEYSGSLLYDQIDFMTGKRAEPEIVSQPKSVVETEVVFAAEPTSGSGREIVSKPASGSETDSVLEPHPAIMEEKTPESEEKEDEKLETEGQEEKSPKFVGKEGGASEEEQPGPGKSFLKGLSEMYPFEDDEIDWCLQMKPEDFNAFPMEYWHYARNSFLLQGFYNYRHLVYAHTNGKNYVGVPGQFIRKEQYLATRFGFNWFKQIRKKKLSMGDYGYWLREL